MPARTLVLSVLAATLASTPAALAQDPGTGAVGGGPAPRVLLVGDSWAELMWINGTLRDVFAANGRPDLVEEGDVTAISGSTAADWTDPVRLQSITDELAAHPTIEVVQLTLGGNDFLDGQPGGGWYVGISAEDLAAMTARILSDASTVIDHILAQDPDLQVLVSLYDYTNFVDSTLFGCSDRWNDLGQPTPRQLNDANADLQVAFQELIEPLPRVSLVDHLGLMQFTYGFPDDGIAPGDLLPPGDPDLPSPIEAMLTVVIFDDCIHLDADGYFVIGQNLWNRYYDAHFNGTLFRDGFESGGLTHWTSSLP